MNKSDAWKGPRTLTIKNNTGKPITNLSVAHKWTERDKIDSYGTEHLAIGESVDMSIYVGGDGTDHWYFSFYQNKTAYYKMEYRCNITKDDFDSNTNVELRFTDTGFCVVPPKSKCADNVKFNTTEWRGTLGVTVENRTGKTITNISVFHELGLITDAYFQDSLSNNADFKFDINVGGGSNDYWYFSYYDGDNGWYRGFKEKYRCNIIEDDLDNGGNVELRFTDTGFCVIPPKSKCAEDETQHAHKMQ